MNPRERLLLAALIGVVGFGAFAIGTYVWFVKPVIANRKTIQNMRQENELEQAKWENFLFERKKLELARLKSLPARASDAKSVYGYYLEKMVQQSGLTLGGVQSTEAVRMKPITALPNVKEVGHQVMTFTVSARGELAELVKLMELLQATPYEHRIRSLNVDRSDMSAGKSAGKKLNINMVIETLLVAKNENRPGHPPGVNTECLVVDHIAGRSMQAPMGWGLVGNMVALRNSSPTPPDRRYAKIAEKNIFVGAMPIEKVVKEKKEIVIKDRSPGNIPGYIRLVHTVPTQQEAYLINLFYRNEELKLSSNPKTGYQVRRISDDNGTYVFFFMKVLRVDSGYVYFQVKDQVHWIGLGQTLADAVDVQEPLTEDEITGLGLAVDEDWAKTQTKGGTKGKTKGG